MISRARTSRWVRDRGKERGEIGDEASLGQLRVTFDWNAKTAYLVLYLVTVESSGIAAPCNAMLAAMFGPVEGRAVKSQTGARCDAVAALQIACQIRSRDSYVGCQQEFMIEGKS